MRALERKCLALSSQEKKDLVDKLIRSIHEEERKTGSGDERGKELHDIVCEVMGFDEIPDSKEVMPVLARSLIAYQMYLEGYRTTYIGKVIHRDHSSVNNLVERMKNMIMAPHFYPLEMQVWDKFKKRIEHETD